METDINKRFQEVSDFCFFAGAHDFRYEINQAYLIKMIPFRDSYDIEREIFDISKFLGVDIREYRALLLAMANRMWPNYDPNWIVNWCILHGFDTETMSRGNYRSWLLGNEKFVSKLSKQQIDANLSIVFGNTTDSFRNALLGEYAEWAVCEYLQSQNCPIDWASHTIGDGLGYDIITYNGYDNTYNYLEVKGTGNLDEDYCPNITNNERRTLHRIENNNLNEKYRVILVPVELVNGTLHHDIVTIPYTKDEDGFYLPEQKRIQLVKGLTH